MKWIFQLLKVLSALAVSFVFLPPLVMVGGFFKIIGGNLFWFGPFLVMTAACGLGIFWKGCLHRKLEKSCGCGLILANLLSFLLAAACGAGGGMLAGYLPGMEVLSAFSRISMQILSGLLTAAAFFSGDLAFEQRYGDILSNGFLMGYVSDIVVCLLISWFTKGTLPGTLVSACFLIALTTSMLARNQSNIDYLMERRKHSLSHLPAKMRWYSLGLTGVCILGMSLFFCFRNVLAKLFREILSLLRKGLVWLMQLLFSSGGEENVPGPEPEPPSLERPDLGLPEETEPSIFWTIFGWVLLLGLLALLFYYRREIWHSVRDTVRKIADFFRRLLNRKAPAAAAEESEFYRDDVEELPHEPVQQEPKRRKAYDMRAWKRDCRRFRAMPEGVPKAREGYRLVLSWLLLKGLPVTAADTPAEVLKKAEQTLPAETFAAVTDAYRAVRYGDQPPEPEDFQKLSDLIFTLPAA